MNEFEKSPDPVGPKTKRDHPEQYPTEKESLFDKFVSERTVDPIPVEDVNLEQEEEKHKEASKQESSSERKYPK
ncbi:hypothetical protein LJK88_31950 [Paenibacillus sp. P26]|nr:hypothetical protein LJK88_31950 [Paenibacillus sp. P26]UUZ94190.1 hypothetical protein LJK87_06125 [Paenibacillus sp. P25]